jgi:peptidylprolyl isomerase
MKFFLSVICFVYVFLLSCEDTKKEKQVLTKNVTTASTISEKNSVETEIPSEKKYPKITQENVVDFLTQYGKDNPETKVRITTTHGNIDLEFYEDTPLHRANYIYLVKKGYFNNTFFHRVVPNFIIQGGNSDNADTNKKRFALGKDYLIPAEINGRNHTYGSVSGAKQYRENPDKKTAPFEFFIFLGPQTSTSHLNGNYTVLATVSKGMDVVEKIANLPADETEWPQKNVVIKADVIE